MTPAALLIRVQSIRDLSRLLAEQADELRLDISSAIWIGGERNANIDNAACYFGCVPGELRNVVDRAQTAMTHLAAAAVLAKTPDASDAEVDAEINRRIAAR